ncbi:type I polyketide synthase [Actinoalloteichus sp. GBA129-24]|uniref:type I polyketide synthase n=1 Tax=Actinoalloteichus sp. GBA129-24 TaxID=1612551 RepID=UPI00095049FC|nr:type I polyketide synthase [Actinoalloteichus sp. GBA129-24]APU21369.1 polyketide synthase family protein [Actinoalloteichus sp. GBA129-24]
MSRAATDVAVVGMSCSLPGAHDPDAYWTLLTQARTSARRPAASVEDGPTLLALVRKALTTAGIAQEDFRGSGVEFFLGVPAAGHDVGSRGLTPTVTTGAASALRAVLLATRSLRDGRTDVTLAGGVDGPESAVGIVLVLKTLTRARADGDRVHAVLRVDDTEPASGPEGTLPGPGLASGMAALLEAVLSVEHGRPSSSTSGAGCRVVVAAAANEDFATGGPGLRNGPFPLVVSGATQDDVRARARRLLAQYEENRPGLRDLAMSIAAAEPSAAGHRTVLWADDEQQLTDELAALACGDRSTSLVSGSAAARNRIVFVFPGQGSQWIGMAAGLLDDSDVFRDAVDASARALAPYIDWSLEDVLRGTPGSASLDRDDVVQPALFAVMVALAELWKSFGVRPAAVLGHSNGEIAAAVVAGGLSLEDGARVVSLWSGAQARLAGRGGMISVSAPLASLEPKLAEWGDRVAVAAVNGPRSVILSGDRDVVDRLLDELPAEGMPAKRIPVDLAAHSSHIEALREEILTGLAPVEPRTATVPFHSTVTGDFLDTTTLDAAYWYSNLRNTVRFERSVRALAADHQAFVEISPHPVITLALQQTLDDLESDAVVVETLRRDELGTRRFLASLARLHNSGATVHWRPAFGPDASLIDLPASVPGHAPAAEAPGAAAEQVTDGLLELVRIETALVLGLDADAELDGTDTFQNLGLDSARAVELRNRLVDATGARLPVTLLFDHPTPEQFAQQIAARLTGTATAAVPVTTRPVGDADEPIAIVSMACRFPGDVASPEDLWQMVLDEKDVISEFPVNRGWPLDALFDDDPDRAGRSYTRHGGFLHDADRFDAEFFGISPREALAMDPQQRLILETVWEALERTGVDPAVLRDSGTGVYLGALAQDYGPRLHEADDRAGGYLLTGNFTSVLSGRVAYTLGLHGPAVTVDTACSSSLVALHLAAQALRAGDCDLAVAGGVTVMSSPGIFVEFSRQRALAPDGRCKAFAEGADGTGWGEGVGVLLLEKLSDARRNGHEVLAVVRGSAVNQDGASNGLAAPNGLSQQRVIQQALANAGVRADEVDAVEGHGTGTALGDPIEAQALLATYGQGRPEDRPLWLGSLKSNIGHAQAAAGVGGVIKMVMAMRHGRLPRTLHVDAPSSHVDWASGSVELLTEARSWPDPGRPRRVGVSSFGVSGTNAHVIIEQGPVVEFVAGVGSRVVTDGALPWPVSAKSEAALGEQARRLLDHLDRCPQATPAQVGHALVAGRSVFDHRAVVIGRDMADFRGALASLATGEPSAHVVTGVAVRSGKTVMVFPGQGSQWVGMGVELMGSSPVFAEHLRVCAAVLEPFTGWDLVDVLSGVEGAPGLDRVDVVQPVLWAVMVSLARLWEHLGVVPDAVVGHSQGEIAAAHIAGVLTLEDSARLVALRSQALMGLRGLGRMLTVLASEDRVRAMLGDGDGSLSVAAVNGPATVTVSGSVTAVAEFNAVLSKAGLMRWELPGVDFAAHSLHVVALREELLELLAPVRPCPAAVAFYSTVAGHVGGPIVDTTVMDAEYWYENLASTVDFQAATRALLDDGHTLFVEASPHPVLTSAVQETVEDHAGAAEVTGTLRREDGGWHRVLTSLATTHTHASVDWSGFYPETRPTHLDLPTYPFQHQHYWLLDADPSGTGHVITGSEAPDDTEFWNAVEREDLDAVIGTLGLGDADSERDAVDSALPAVLSAMSSWRRRRLDRSLMESRRYRVTWKPLPGIESGAAGRLAGSTWLVVVPESATSDPVVDKAIDALRRRRAEVVRWDVASADLRDRAALGRRLTAMAADGTVASPLTGVLSLAALVDDGLGAAHEPVSAGLAGTVALLQALDDAGVEARLWCLTREAVSTGNADTLANPLQAQVWGLGRTVALERPERWGGLVDVPARLDGPVADLLCAVLADVDGADGPGRGHGEDQVAVRPSGAFGRRLTRAPLGDAPAPDWRPTGTVLVTGGAGAVGSHVCRWLARAGAPNLLLVGRRGRDTPGIAELEAELTGLGSPVTVAAVDVADRDVLRELLASVPAEHPLTAVFHGAGALADGLVESLTAERLEQVLRPKVAAATALHELTADLGLEAFVLFSSATGVLGNGGQAGYAAANAFLDALAEVRRAAGLPATAVAWGSWGGGGLVTGEVDERLRRRGLPPMAPETAVAALAAALTRGEMQVMVAQVEWTDFAAAFTAARPSRLIADLPDTAVRTAAGSPAGHAGDASEGDLVARLKELPERKLDDALLGTVRAHAAAVLGLDGPDQIGGERAFSLAGFDSLTSVELRNRLRRVTGLRLPTTLLFDYPTPVAAARYLRAKLFPERTAGGSAPGGVATDVDDAEVRELVLSISPARLREAGLLESLLSLAGHPAAGGTDTGGASHPPENGDGPSLDEMGVADLVRMAMRNDVPDGTGRS